MAAKPILYIGNKNYSSWSMRPWLAMTWAGIAFEERVIPLGGPGYGKSQIPEVLAASPSGRVPVLHVGDIRIWDSLAICEWAAEARPAVGLWPTDDHARAVARAASCEMHAGFAALRRDLSMNVRRRTGARDWPADTQQDIARIQELWGALRGVYGREGPYLFGGPTIADAMFAPVCTRFRTYGVQIGPVAQAYCDTIFNDAAFRAWEKAAEAEPWSIPKTDAI